MRRLAVLSGVLLVAGCGSAPSVSSPASPPVLSRLLPAVKTAVTSPFVSVGPGSAEAGLRQATRTLDGHVWISAIDDDGFRTDPPVTPQVQLRTYVSTTSGIPTAFREVDAAHAPRVPVGFSMSGVDTRLDRAGILHLAYYRTDTDRCVHQTLDTRTQRYGRAEDVATGGRTASTPVSYYGVRGQYLCSLTLLGDDTPELVVAGDDGVTAYVRASSGWRSDGRLSSLPATHPSMVTDHQGRAQVSWLSQDDAIDWSVRSSSGQWSTPAVIDSGNPSVLSDGDLDQGPSLAVNSADEPSVVYLSGHSDEPDDRLKVAQRSADGSWVHHDIARFAHSPGIDLRGDDVVVVLGHDDQIHPGWTELVDGTWTPTHPFVTTGKLDGSANTRFDPLRDPQPDLIDVVAFDENSDVRGSFKPDLYYDSVQLPPSTAGSAPTLLQAPRSVTTGSRAVLVGQASTVGQSVSVQAVDPGGVTSLFSARTGADQRVLLTPRIVRSTNLRLVSSAGTSVLVRIAALWQVSLHRAGARETVKVSGPGSRVHAQVQRLVGGRWRTSRNLTLRPGRTITISRPSGSWRLVVPAQSGLATTTVTA